MPQKEKNEYIERLIRVLGFTSENSNKNIWLKKYQNHNEYIISIDFDKSQIDFGNLIRKGDDTTSNFSKYENFVVLECVDRLLTKGYKPSDLILEKKWKLGLTAKSGKADINVIDKNGKTILIIECKTWGEKFEKEKQTMKQNGGQLFSYFQQDKSTRYLCLYASRLHSNNIESSCAIVNTEDSLEEITTQRESDKIITYQKATIIDESINVWFYKNGKDFLERGIFEEDIEPYNPGFIPLRIKDLKKFNQDDAKIEYYQFEEILRHNNISDRSNAFNRFISLVLAKIVDEEKPANAIAEFQIKEGIDTPEDFIERLQMMYTKAMKEYLGETVINYTFEDIENIVSHFPRQTAREDLKRIYKELKFYTNNEFSFKEIYNHELFEQNSKVIYEVVKRLQRFRFKYNARAQFLGDFFEDMLESGFKQSEGQFFTPTPIAKFIISSIPLKEIIERKIENQEAKILPYVIDYACGSGHFITEALEEIQQTIIEFDDTVHKMIPEYQKSLKWGGDYICGIEKDYRLARTSQVACFMHGDGDVKIIFGDGLEEHHKMPAKLYDVLVANPPYTIKDFKKHLNFENLANFELIEDLSIDSDDIEVLFVERTKQLLKQNGYAGIFLPSSILTNPGIYEKAREIILKYFEIKAIVEMGNSTFSATGTSTVILFMERRPDDYSKNCLYIANDLILGNDFQRANDFVNSQDLLSNYIELLGLDLKEYKNFLEKNPSKAFKETEFFQNYFSWFNKLTEIKNLKKNKNITSLSQKDLDKKFDDIFYEYIFKIEKEKFYYFLLCHRQIEIKDENNKITKIKFLPQRTLIINSGKDKNTQKEFLGYSFSNRRGYKGLDLKLDESGVPTTKMYDPTNKSNNKKVNYYIEKAFKNEEIKEVSTELEEFVFVYELLDCLNFDRESFEKQIYTSKIHNPYLESKFPLERFIKVASLEYGASLPKPKRIEGNYPVMGSNGITGNHYEYLIEGPAIIVGRKGSAGKVNYITENCYPIDTTFYVKCKKDKDDLKYIYYYLRSLNLEDAVKQLGVPGLNRTEVHNLKIPIIPKTIRDKIIKTLDSIEENKTKYFDDTKTWEENELTIFELQNVKLKDFLI